MITSVLNQTTRVTSTCETKIKILFVAVAPTKIFRPTLFIGFFSCFDPRNIHETPCTGRKHMKLYNTTVFTELLCFRYLPNRFDAVEMCNGCLTNLYKSLMAFNQKTIVNKMSVIVH